MLITQERKLTDDLDKWLRASRQDTVRNNYAPRTLLGSIFILTMSLHIPSLALLLFFVQCLAKYPRSAKPKTH